MKFTLSSMYALGLAGLTFNRKHLLSALLCLEGMMLTLFLALSLWVLQFNSMNFAASPLLLLAFSACEAGVGLALLVSTVRTHGSDHLSTLNLLQC
uniref:NADH-ubiquinone oxidoreductase chain 4L n=1 Tax=Epiplatys togolensis TaxID=1795788 RepID=A0A517Y404_9TELE|nr:NADH dehydrogenase subunit 4L [Epiplatys togolensis]QDU24731.1 NADH dehydrogenase subunit 4L [Epiplatys togolensis]